MLDQTLGGNRPPRDDHSNTTQTPQENPITSIIESAIIPIIKILAKLFLSESKNSKIECITELANLFKISNLIMPIPNKLSRPKQGLGK